MLGIYLSGTGNTRHCTEKRAAELLSEHDFIVLAYPVQYSNEAKRQTISMEKLRIALWQGKSIFMIWLI